MIRKLFAVITYLIVIAFALTAAAAVVFRLLGWQAFSVLSGSMEPRIMTGSLIWVKPVAPEAVEPGMVITYLLDEKTVATHRVTRVLPDETDSTVLRFRTKGDANETEDAASVHENNLIGTPVLTLPGAGYAISWVKYPPGRWYAMGIGGLLVFALFLPDLLPSKSKRDIAGNG